MPEESNPVGFQAKFRETFREPIEKEISNFNNLTSQLTSPQGQSIRKSFERQFGDSFRGVKQITSQVIGESPSTILEGINTPIRETNLFTDIVSGFRTQFAGSENQFLDSGNESLQSNFRQFQQTRAGRARPIEQLQGFVGQGSDVTFAQIVGGNLDEDPDEKATLRGAMFQLQQSSVISTALARNQVVNLTTQALDLDPESDNDDIKRRASILAPNELAITAVDTISDNRRQVTGVTFPEASFHPKVTIRRFKEKDSDSRKILASIGTQNITTGLRAQSTESLLVFQGFDNKKGRQEDTFVGVAKQLEAASLSINQKIGEAQKEDNVSEKLEDLVQKDITEKISETNLDQAVFLGRRYLSRIQETLSGLKDLAKNNSNENYTVYLSFGEVAGLFGKGVEDPDNNNTISLIRKHLNELLTNSQDYNNVNVKLLTTLGGKQNKDVINAINNQGSDNQDQLAQNLINNRSIVDVPSSFYHDKSFGIVKHKGDNPENDELIAYGVGSAQLTQQSLQNNIELGVFFRGNQTLLGSQDGYEGHDDVLNRLQQGKHPITKRFSNLAFDGQSPTGSYSSNFLTEGITTVDTEEIQKLRNRLDSVMNQYSGQIQVRDRYQNLQEGRKLTGLDVTVSDAHGGQKTSLSFTVKKEGGRSVVHVLNKDVNISGSIYENRTGQTITMDVAGSDGNVTERQVRNREAVKLGSFDTTAAIVGTVARTLDEQTRFRAVDETLQALTDQEKLRAGQYLLGRQINKAFYNQGYRQRETLGEQFSFLQGLSSEERVDVVTEIDRQLSSDRFERSDRLKEAQRQSLKPIRDNLFASVNASDIETLASQTVGRLVSALHSSEEGRSLLDHLKFNLIQESEMGKLYYQTLNQTLSKEVEEKVLETFFQSHESIVSGYQAFARLPVFGITEEDTQDIYKDVDYTLGTHGLPTSHALIQPLSLKHGDLITTRDKPKGGAFFRRVSSVSYDRPKGAKTVGGLRQVKTPDEEKDRGAATFYDWEDIMRGMAHVSMVRKSEFETELGHIERITGHIEGIENFENYFPEEEEDEEDPLLFLFPFKKSAQVSQRLSNMIGTRPLEELNPSVARKVYSGQPLNMEDIKDENFNIGEISGALPQKQFDYVKQVFEEEKGKDPTLGNQELGRVVRDRLRRELGQDPGTFARGIIDQNRPRLIGVVLGSSSFSDFSFNNPDYEAEFGYGVKSKIQFNVNEVYDQYKTRDEIARKLAPGTRIFSSPTTLEIDGEEPQFFSNIRERFRQRNQNRENSGVEDVIREIRETISFDIRENLNIKSFKTQEGKDDIAFELKPGAYQFNEEGRPTKTADLDSQGYLTVSHKYTSTAQGDEVAPIKFKVPSNKDKYEKGVTVITDMPKGELADNRFILELKGRVLKTGWGTGLRPGSENIKAPQVFLGSEYFQMAAETLSQSGEEDFQKFLPSNVKDENTGRITSKDIYGIYGEGSLKSFNTESGLYLIENPTTRQQLTNQGGKEIAETLSLLFLDDKTKEGNKIAELLKSSIGGNIDSSVATELEQRAQKAGGEKSKLQTKGQKSQIEHLGMNALGLLSFAEFESIPDDGQSSVYRQASSANIAPSQGIADKEANPLDSVKELVAKALRINDEEESVRKEAEEAQETLQNRMGELLSTVKDNYSFVKGENQAGEELSINATSPVTRGASLVAYLSLVGRQLLNPNFMIDKASKAVYDAPHPGLVDSNQRRNLAQRITDMELTELRGQGLQHIGSDHLSKGEPLDYATKESILEMAKMTTDYSIRNEIRRRSGNEAEAISKVEDILEATHLQLQSQLLIAQPVKLNPSQSLVATGTQNVGNLEYQYLQQYSQTLSREFLHEPTDQEMDIRLAYGIIANSLRGDSFKVPTSSDEALNLSSVLAGQYAGNNVARKTNEIAMNLPSLGIPGEENLSKLMAEKLLQAEGDTYESLLEHSKRIKETIKGYKEGYDALPNQERVKRLQFQVQELNEFLTDPNRGFDPIPLKASPRRETVKDLSKAFGDFQEQVTYQDFDLYLRQHFSNVHSDLVQTNLLEDVVDPISGQLRIESIDQLQTVQQENVRRIEKSIKDSQDVSASSNLLQSMRTLWSVAHEQGRDQIKQELTGTREIIIPQVALEDDRAVLADTTENEPLRLLQMGLEIDELKLEYPGFEDRLLSLQMRARLLNEQLREVDRQLQTRGSVQLNNDMKEALRERESIATQVRGLIKNISTTSIAERAAGDYKEIPGTSYPAIRSYLVNFDEIALGGRIDDIQPKQGLSDPSFRELKNQVRDLIQERFETEMERLDQEERKYEEVRASNEQEVKTRRLQIISLNETIRATKRRRDTAIDNLNEIKRNLKDGIYNRGKAIKNLKNNYDGSLSLMRSPEIRKEGRPNIRPLRGNKYNKVSRYHSSDIEDRSGEDRKAFKEFFNTPITLVAPDGKASIRLTVDPESIMSSGEVSQSSQDPISRQRLKRDIRRQNLSPGRILKLIKSYEKEYRQMKIEDVEDYRYENIDDESLRGELYEQGELKILSSREQTIENYLDPSNPINMEPIRTLVSSIKDRIGIREVERYEKSLDDREKATRKATLKVSSSNIQGHNKLGSRLLNYMSLIRRYEDQKARQLLGRDGVRSKSLQVARETESMIQSLYNPQNMIYEWARSLSHDNNLESDRSLTLEDVIDEETKRKISSLRHTIEGDKELRLTLKDVYQKLRTIENKIYEGEDPTEKLVELEERIEGSREQSIESEIEEISRQATESEREAQRLESEHPWLSSLYQDYENTKVNIGSEQSPILELFMRGLQGDEKISLSQETYPNVLTQSINKLHSAESYSQQEIDEVKERLRPELESNLMRQTIRSLEGNSNIVSERYKGLTNLNQVTRELRQRKQKLEKYYSNRLRSELPSHQSKYSLEISELELGKMALNITSHFKDLISEIEELEQRSELTQEKINQTRDEYERLINGLYESKGYIHEDKKRFEDYRTQAQQEINKVRNKKKKLVNSKRLINNQLRSQDPNQVTEFIQDLATYPEIASFLTPDDQDNIFSILRDYQDRNIGSSLSGREILDQAIAMRGGAPSNIASTIEEALRIVDITTIEKINEKANWAGSLFAFALERSKTAMVTSGSSPIFTQQGDYDGDTYLALLSKTRFLAEERNNLIREAMKADEEVRKLDKRISQLQQYDDRASRTKLQELREQRNQKTDSFNRLRQSVDEKDQELKPILDEQESRKEERPQSLQRSLRSWAHTYTGFSRFALMNEGTKEASTFGDSQVASTFGYGAQEEILTTQDLSTWMTSMRAVNEKMMQAQKGSEEIIQIRNLLRSNRSDILEGENDINLQSFLNKLREKGEKQTLIQRLEKVSEASSNQKMSEEAILQEVSKQHSLGTGLDDFGSLISNLSAEGQSAAEVEASLGTIGITGGQVLGEAYNAFVPMMHQASALKGLQEGLEGEMTLNGEVRSAQAVFQERVEERLKNKLRAQGRDEKTVQDMAPHRAEQLVDIQGMDEYYRSINQLVSNIQVIIRDDALKPKKEGGVIGEVRTLIQEEGERFTRPSTEQQQRVRKRLMESLGFSDLGTPLGFEFDKHFKDQHQMSSMGLMRLASVYMESDEETLQAELKVEAKEQTLTRPEIQSVLNLYQLNHGEEADARQDPKTAFEEAMVEYSARTQASFQAHSNFDMDNKDALVSQIRRTYAKSKEILETIGERDPATREEAKEVEEARVHKEAVEARISQKLEKEGVDPKQIDLDDSKVARNQFDNTIGGDEAQEIIAQTVYNNLMTESRRNLTRETFRRGRELVQATNLLRQSDDLDQSLIEKVQQVGLTSLQAVNQRGHFESPEQHHKTSLSALRMVHQWMEREQGYERFDQNGNDQGFDQDRTKVEARKKVISELISGFGLTVDQEMATETDRQAFVEAMFEGYNPDDPNSDTSIFRRLLSHREGVEEQVKYIDQLIQIEEQLKEVREQEDTEETRQIQKRLQSQYQEALKQASPSLKGLIDEPQSREQTQRDLVQRGQDRTQKLQEARQRTLEVNNRLEQEQMEQRYEQQFVQEQVQGQRSELISGIAAPAILTVMGSGFFESLDERSALFAYDVLQATAETSTTTPSTEPRSPVEKHIAGGGEDLNTAAKAFRMQRIRSAAKSQETLTEGAIAGFTQEAAIRAMGQASQAVTKRINKGGRGRTAVSLGLEMVGDAMMMGVGRAVAEAPAIPSRGEQPLSPEMYELLKEQANQLLSRIQRQQEAVSEGTNMATFVYNEAVDFTASTEPTIQDEAELGIRVLNEDGEESVIATDAKDEAES